MVRIQIKGGVWKNSEDEILKVAVMKYGKNQWARISSLLVRKSAKQCKARWFEWLDPSIKKTEWTRDEEEKLLHLAKIMPTQWRTIAPIVGRTAAQCLEHYEKLLDAAQEKDGEYDPADDPRRLRAGEIDPNPEARPARPDAVDMDEDEKEMLSEARARLANTKGKKAKRKAREKQLEEARRLASLQKKRELRAAGIEIRRHKRKRKFGIDYNEEIPFERRPAPGFFDVTKDRQLTIDMKNDPSMYNNVDLRDLEGKRRDEEEERERKKDAKRQKLHRKTDLPGHILQINKMNDPTFIQRRTNLALPSPQISDSELFEIAKLGGVVAAPPVGQGSAATKTLLASYGNATPLPTPGRTPRTPIGRDTLLEEAQNLIALTNQQTPLKGGENAVLHATDFGGITPKNRLLATPNALATPGGATPSRTPGQTPKGQTPSATPMRDELHINEGLSAEEALEMGSKRAQKRYQEEFKRKLAKGLGALPKATNEYVLVKPELPPEVEDTFMKPLDEEEDAEDAVLRIAEMAKALEDSILRKRHIVLQRRLPRPLSLNTEMGKGSEGVEDLLRKEMVAMLRYDAFTYPIDGEEEEEKDGKKKKKKKVDASKMPKLAMLEEEELREARALILDELAKIDHPLKDRSMTDDSDSDEEESVLAAVSSPFVAQAWQEANSDVCFVPADKQYGRLSKLGEAQQVQVYQQEFAMIRGHLLNELKKCSKLEGRLNIVLGGYRQRAGQGVRAFAESCNAMQQCKQEHSCFDMLLGLESLAVPQRVRILEKETAVLGNIENNLQAQYAKLLKQKSALQIMLAKQPKE